MKIKHGIFSVFLLLISGNVHAAELRFCQHNIKLVADYTLEIKYSDETVDAENLMFEDKNVILQVTYPN